MNPPIFINNVVRFKNNDHKFYTKYTKNKFLGYHILPYYDTSKTENVIDLSYLKIGDKLSSIEKTPVVNIHTTEPPALYNEGSLVKALKEAGVGRPSTYSSMVGIVQSRGYVINDTNGLSPTDKGVLVITNLLKGFKDIVSKKFTVEMENDLDKISTGQLN
jgi:DNA topoisomerase-1